VLRDQRGGSKGTNRKPTNTIICKGSLFFAPVLREPQDLLGPRVEEKIRAVRDVLLEVDFYFEKGAKPLFSIIAMKKFYQGLSEIKLKARSALDNAIAAIHREL
jgi:hypothetical protein